MFVTANIAFVVILNRVNTLFNLAFPSAVSAFYSLVSFMFCPTFLSACFVGAQV